MKRLGHGRIYTTTDHNVTSMVPGSAYITNSASQLTFTLPANCKVGDTFNIIGGSDGGWIINKGIGQTLYYKNEFVPNIESVFPYSSITIVCVTENTDFIATEFDWN